MPKYKKYTGEVKEHSDWVIDSLASVIVDGKTLKNGGWTRIADVDDDTQNVLDSTKPLTKEEREAIDKDLRQTRTATLQAIKQVAGFVEDGQAEAAKEFLEAAKAALETAKDLATRRGTAGATKIVAELTQAVEEAQTAVDSSSTEDSEEDDLLGDVKQ